MDRRDDRGAQARAVANHAEHAVELQRIESAKSAGSSVRTVTSSGSRASSGM